MNPDQYEAILNNLHAMRKTLNNVVACLKLGLFLMAIALYKLFPSEWWPG